MMERIKKNLTKDLAFFVATPALIWQLLFLFLPILFLIILSFQTKDHFGFTTEYFSSVIDFFHFKVIFRSIIIALFNTTLCLIMGYPIAYFLALKIERFKNLWIFFLTLPMWVNFLIQVYSWFFILEPFGIVNKILLYLNIISEPIDMINNLFSILLVMFHVYLPFMIMPLFNVLEKFDIQLKEASLDLGANQWQTFLKVTFPLSMSGVKLGFFLVFVLSFGEVVIPILMGGNKTFFVGTLISEYFLGARNINKGAAFTILSSLVLILTLTILYYLLNKKVRNVK